MCENAKYIAFIFAASIAIAKSGSDFQAIPALLRGCSRVITGSSPVIPLSCYGLNRDKTVSSACLKSCCPPMWQGAGRHSPPF